MSQFKITNVPRYFELDKNDAAYVCRIIGDTSAARVQLGARHPYMVTPLLRASNVIQLTPTTWGEYHYIVAPTPENKTISYEAVVVDGRCVICYRGPFEDVFKHFSLQPSFSKDKTEELKTTFEENKKRVLSAIY